MAAAARAARVLTFVLSLIVIPTMVILSIYAGSRWGDYADDPESQAVFWLTIVLWLAALVCLGLAARSGRTLLYTASLVLFALTLVGEAFAFVVFTVT
jgi:hypothetical protein